MVVRVWVRNEDSGDVAASGGGAGRGAGYLFGRYRACRDPEDRGGGTCGVRDLGILAVDDRDEDGQRGVWRPGAAVMISNDDLQLARCLDGAGGAAHAARNVAAAFTSCCGPTTSAVGIPREAAKTAS